jgi:threonine dehydrogenase-like Zn-dependent dehydrogenase
MGARQVILFDLVEGKLQLAKSFGFDKSFNVHTSTLSTKSTN